MTELLSNEELARAESAGYVLGANNPEKFICDIVQGVLTSSEYNPIDRGLVAASVLRGHVTHQ